VQPQVEVANPREAQEEVWCLAGAHDAAGPGCSRLLSEKVCLGKGRLPHSLEALDRFDSLLNDTTSDGVNTGVQAMPLIHPGSTLPGSRAPPFVRSTEPAESLVALRHQRR
jgi:hypothetical protein